MLDRLAGNEALKTELGAIYTLPLSVTVTRKRRPVKTDVRIT